MNYWLFKKELKNISIEDIKRKGVQNWHGVRNYQARNFMRDAMQPGDLVLVYHSNSEPSVIVGIAEIGSQAYDDVTAQDPSSYHYDPKATPLKPIWLQIDIRFIEQFSHIISLADIRKEPALNNMLVIRRGMRLSIQPVTKEEFDKILAISHSS